MRPPIDGELRGHDDNNHSSPYGSRNIQSTYCTGLTITQLQLGCRLRQERQPTAVVEGELARRCLHNTLGLDHGNSILLIRRQAVSFGDAATPRISLPVDPRLVIQLAWTGSSKVGLLVIGVEEVEHLNHHPDRSSSSGLTSTTTAM